MSAKQDEGDDLPTLEELLNANLRRRVRPKQKPTLVVDGDKIAGSATVHLSPSDPNWRGSNSQYVRVLDRWDDDFGAKALNINSSAFAQSPRM